MKNKRLLLDKLTRLQNQIQSWVRDESDGQSEDHRLKIIQLVQSDYQFVTQLHYGVTTNAATTRLQIDKPDMKRCNTIFKRYSAISDIQFGEHNPFEGVTIVKPAFKG